MHWVTTPTKLEEYEEQGLILWPAKEDGVPRLKYYLSQSPGVPLSDFWEDINLISSSAAESLGYPTQKPEALLTRVIEASCPPNGVVLDPFCGCGTTVAAAEKMKRNWIGIDITHLAVTLIKSRLSDIGAADYTVVGEPTDFAGAEQLAKDNKYQFQFWALGLLKLNARPAPADEKKGPDQGIDGRVSFFDGDPDPRQVIISVKGGKVSVAQVRDLRGVIDREKAEFGILVSLNEPTPQMRKEAASAGFYKSQYGSHPRLQLMTVGELLEGKTLDLPPEAFHKMEAAAVKQGQPVAPGQMTLKAGEEDGLVEEN